MNYSRYHEEMAEQERMGELILGLMTVGQLAALAVDEALADADVTASVAGVLWVLRTNDSPPTMREIAARLRCDPSTVSLTADKLERLHLITRQPHPTDGRKRILELTADGEQLWETLNQRLQTSPVLSGLDSGQQGTLLELLGRIQAARS
jgi:DNA-binding MarR family transcriptional regulator